MSGPVFNGDCVCILEISQHNKSYNLDAYLEGVYMELDINTPQVVGKKRTEFNGAVRHPDIINTSQNCCSGEFFTNQKRRFNKS